MALPVEWSREAEITYINVIASIGEKWTEREVEQFINRTVRVLGYISERPAMCSQKKIVTPGCYQ